MASQTKIYRLSSECVTRYDRNTGRLFLVKPWGILCLHARPFSATGIDLQQGCEWVGFSQVRLDLRPPLRQVRRLVSQRHAAKRTQGVWTAEPERSDVDAATQSARAWHAFFRDVGGLRLARLVARFHPSFQFAILWHATRNKRLALLARSNPGLLVGVLLKAQTVEPDLPAQHAAIDKLAAGKERDIASCLGFKLSAWRVLARISPRSLTAERWTAFQVAWNQSQAVRTVARHLSRLDGVTVDLLADPLSHEVLDHCVFHQLAVSTWQDDFSPPVETVSWVLHVLNTKGRQATPGPGRIRSLAKLKKAVSLVSSHVDNLDVLNVRALSFPYPPFAGEPGYIEPIRTVDELCLETITMRNCSLSFARNVADREICFFRAYRRYGMERCTIQLTPVEEHGRTIWKISEVRAESNRRCKRSTIDALDCFFEQQQNAVGGEITPDALMRYANT